MVKDAIIVLGGGINDDGTLPEIPKLRVEKGVELFKQNVSDKLIMSGRWTFLREKDAPRTEAIAMKEYAKYLGVPPESIYLEETSNDTFSNAYFTKVKYLEPKKWKNIVIVTSDFHMERTKFIFEFVLGKCYKIRFVSSSSNVSKSELSNLINGEQRILKMMKQMLASVQEGNDEQIKQFLFTEHPGYAKNSPYKKEQTLALLGA